MTESLTVPDPHGGGPDPKLLQAALKRLLRSVTDQLAAELIDEHARRIKPDTGARFTPSTHKE